MEMVIKMEYVLKVDRQGRVVLPVEFRRELGIKNGGSIVLKKKNSRIYVEVGGDLEGKVEQWKEKLKGMEVKAQQFKPGESKWVSENWVRKKLGIQV
ncbi:spoVT / AbrB like domain protein [archaeon BMS3Bbin15]|nr:spoVT / AbrB like domain protein [archaeon BMS3Bbin15]